MKETKQREFKKEAIEAILEHLDGYTGYYCDLHNEAFNMNYHFVGSYYAECELEEYGVFDAIHKIVEWEEFNIGEVNTDFSSPEKVANMLWYVVGDEVIQGMWDIPEWDENWNNVADDDTNEAIIQGMKDCFKYELEA